MVISTYYGPIYCFDFTDIWNLKMIWKTDYTFYCYFNRSFEFNFVSQVIFAPNYEMNEKILKINQRKNKVENIVSHNLNVYTLTKDSDLKRLFSGSFSGDLIVTNLQNKKKLKKIKNLHESYLSNIYFSKIHEFIFTAGWKGKIKILCSKSFKTLKVLKISDSVYFMTFINNDNTIYSGGRNSNEIVKFDLNKG